MVKSKDKLNRNRCLVLAKGVLTNPETNLTAESLIELESGGYDNKMFLN